MAIPSGPASALAMLGFTTRLADGTRVETSNMPFPSIYPPQPGSRGARFRDERAPKRLHALHRARVVEFGPADPAPFGDPVAMQQAIEQAGIDWFVASGYMRRSGDRPRFTLRGAFLSCWRPCFPWAWLDTRRNAAERRRLLSSAGLLATTGSGKSLSNRLLFE